MEGGCVRLKVPSLEVSAHGPSAENLQYPVSYSTTEVTKVDSKSWSMEISILKPAMCSQYPCFDPLLSQVKYEFFVTFQR